MPTENTQFDRKETAIRLLLTLLFVVIVEGIIKAILAVVILFALIYALSSTFALLDGIGVNRNLRRRRGDTHYAAGARA